MKNSSDFKRLARERLSGRWVIALLAGVVASILGGIGSSGPEITFELNEYGANANLVIGNQTVYSTSGGINSELMAFLVGGAIVIVLAALAFAILYFVLGSVVGVGYAKFNLDLIDLKQPEFGTLFDYFSQWKTTAIASLLQSIYVVLWSLLFIIPGIMASYSYAMTQYIIAEHPELTAGEAISLSKEIMRGNRFRLFCLDFSFIGWHILCAFTMGIGNLWLIPYIQASKAAFYREVSGTEYSHGGEYEYEEPVYEGEIF